MDFSQFRENERRGWDERADGYADATARATLQSIPALLSHARLFPQARVLDAGCGPGYVAACASLLGASAMGIDFADRMIDEARRRFPAIRFEVGDVEALPADDQSQDAVLSNIVLFHVVDPFAAMKEAFRVLRPGGMFVFSQWLGPDRSACYRMLYDVLREHADMSRAEPAPDAYVLSDRNGVSDLMLDAGFEGLEFEQVDNVLHAPGPSFFDFFARFGVRVPLIVARQEEDVRITLREEIDRRAEEYLSGGVYRVPMPSLVIAGRRPKAG